jgi:hypothetical protein
VQEDTHMGKTDKRFQCTVNFSICPGECGCIIRCGGKSTGTFKYCFHVFVPEHLQCIQSAIIGLIKISYQLI